MTQATAPDLPLTRLRRTLLEQRDTQAARLASADGTSYTVDYVTDGHDDVLAARLAGISRLLAETEAALSRIEQGGYGTCQACGRDISLVRLEILPHARYCVGCQQDQDHWRGSA
ncbi:MAG TPA: TraR/DksA C4-type zinc finger protein [Nocardioidaceae bacterium]|nr:TraR/DksA C4-type zinc finger protein [Nocardioidaceae bacterium]